MSKPDPASRISAGTRSAHFIGFFQGQTASAPIAKSTPTSATGDELSLSIFLNLRQSHCTLAQTVSSQSNPRNVERIHRQFILLAMIMHKLLFLSMGKSTPYMPFRRYTCSPLWKPHTEMIQNAETNIASRRNMF